MVSPGVLRFALKKHSHHLMVFMSSLFENPYNTDVSFFCLSRPGDVFQSLQHAQTHPGGAAGGAEELQKSLSAVLLPCRGSAV